MQGVLKKVWMCKNSFIVTIDGPAGSGKSTVAKLLSEKDGFFHIDTGAIYRAVGFLFKGNPTKDDIENLHLEFYKNSKLTIMYNGKDMEGLIRSESVGFYASKCAKLSYVRDFVNQKAKDIAINGKFVIDGRDCGSVIFPDADLKIFLTAKIDERAKRRAKEINGNMDKIKKDIILRDMQDEKRNIAPLIRPKDAIEIDSTDMDIESEYLLIKKLIKEKYEDYNS